ncbi:pyruvoyl-dependent arginine decarboxylase [Nocardia sp. NPDC051832]|uniref:pyruvoyl-dependent arginine decarboxylase n=1 Tax=Nocardia sp. NPDC051832 TaxID=3155673 RepID=UPI003435C8B9
MPPSGYPAIPRRTVLTGLAVGAVIAAGGSAAAKPSAPLLIEVAAGTGAGSTRISAFDAAARAVGAANMNLIHLSSVIPPGADVVRAERLRMPMVWGDRLYCVYAAAFAERVGERAAAGLGWVHRQDGSGAGLFVEHTAENVEEVERLIQASLGDMTAGRPEPFGPVELSVVEAGCRRDPVCALVLAAYQTSTWG